MNQQHKDTRKRIKRLIRAWKPRFACDDVDVEHRFHETFLDPENLDQTIAVTKALWEYREAVIHWYLPVACRLSDEELETTLVHEWCHVLLNPIREFVPEEQVARNELATQNVTRALLKTFSTTQH